MSDQTSDLNKQVVQETNPAVIDAKDPSTADNNVNIAAPIQNAAAPTLEETKKVTSITNLQPTTAAESNTATQLAVEPLADIPSTVAVAATMDDVHSKSSEEMDKLINKFKSIVTLQNIKPDMWSPDHLRLIKEFLSTGGEHRIFLWIDNIPGLVIETVPPVARIDELMYVIRDSGALRNGAVITLENFKQNFKYGTIHGNAMESLLRVMNGVYGPLCLENRSWPESAKKEFAGQLHKFMAYLTDTAHQSKGHTVLYVPKENFSKTELLSKDKDTVQRLEGLLVHWTRQIKEVVNNQHTSETAENSGPLEELEFWRSRCDDLSGISKQLNRLEVLQIIAILKLSKSSYLEQFLRLSNLIQQGSLQAQNNLINLSTLQQPCTDLANAEPKSIPKILPGLLTRVRLIWAKSKYYNTRERLTSLLRKVSNEIIKRCRAKISLDEILDGNVETSMISLQESIDCGEEWKQIYKKTCDHIFKKTGKTWDFDTSSIFAQVDAFVQRCRDLLEVCEGQIQFARKIQGGQKAPIPAFGGSKGPEIAKLLEDIDVAFERQLQAMRNVKTYILDVKATRWHDDYNSFKQGVKDLEVMMQNVINTAFENATTIESSLDLLEIFNHLAKREAIKRSVEKKTLDVWNMFMQGMNQAKIEFEVHRKTPELNRFHPDYAGAAFWARSLLKRISYPMKLLENALYLSKPHVAIEYKGQYEQLSSALEDYVSKTYGEWQSVVQNAAIKKLECPLMIRKGGDSLEMRFDKDLLRIFYEIPYWQKLKFDIPFTLQEINSKREELRVLRENVLLVVRDYNSILDTLTADEKLLFKERIRFLDRKIHPGLTTLTWVSKGISEYFVKECRRHSHDVQKIVTEFKEATSKIQRNCNLIADTMLVHIEGKRVYELEEFEKAQESYGNSVKEKLLRAHETISKTLESTFEVFKGDGKDVQQQWVRYIEKTDKIVEESLFSTVKRSLLEISKAINGEGKNREGSNEVQPLFKLNVVLEMQKVEFNPGLSRLEETVNKVAKELISTITVITRFADKYPEATTKNAARIYDIIASEDDILKIFVNIQNGLALNASKCINYVRTWDTYKEIWEINKDAFMRRYAKQKPALSTFDADINRYNEVANNTQKEETIININFIRLDCSPLKHAVVAHCNAWQNKLTSLLNNNASQELASLHQMFIDNTTKLRTPPTDLDKLSDSLNLLKSLQESITDTEARFAPIHEQYQILEKYDVPIKEEEKKQLETMHTNWTWFLQTLSDVEKSLGEDKAKFKSELLSSVDEFSKSIVVMREDFFQKGPFDSSYSTTDAMKIIDDYSQIVSELLNQEKVLRKGLAVFKIEQASSKDLENTIKDLEILTDVWNLNAEWIQDWNQYKKEIFSKLSIDQLEENCSKFQKKLAKIGRDINNWDIYQNLRERIAQLRKVIPIIKDLKNTALRQRHWNKLMDDIGKDFDQNSDEFSLQKIYELGFDQYSENIANLSAAATKELSIELGLQDIKQCWEDLELDIVTYRDDKVYKLRSTDEIFEVLEDNQATLSLMKLSKYFNAFEKQVDHWEKTLSHIMEVIEVTLQVQRQWMYLENIFVGSEDIRKQLPRESSIFDQINLNWKQLMTRFNLNKNVLKATHEQGLFQMLIDMNDKLEKIQRSLDMYLETKRQSFPRFYFLSNDDLLEMLGQSRDPSSIQHHLKKCFDGIAKLELSLKSDGKRHNEAVGMHSRDGEYVPFYTTVLAEGPVESWLLDIETVMRATLQKMLLGCFPSMRKTKTDRWLKDWPGQLLITSSQIVWTADCVKALSEIDKGDKNALRALKKKQVSALRKLADQVRTPLTKVDRKKLIALITIEVHSRDVIEKLTKLNVSNVSSFEWLSQLRFYWDKEFEDCTIQQTNTKFTYGYEYLGNSGRLVITPLTDRCYMTLTTALHLHRGGSPQGPAGTGKTETVKDLGKALGKYVIVQNCSEGLDFKSMGRMFSGLAQTGAWGCFDEFNRIDIEVLSVVALQISAVLSAIARKATVFVFEGKEIRIDNSCGIFITMNPGYAGRVELPDNLKSLFRPVSMMVPDSALIAEIMLFAEGFNNNRLLAKKVDTLYKLAIQQLSKQDHYDFGLRALTSALRTAGTRKRVDPNAADEPVLYLAMRDMNMPKLTAEDVPLFMGILSDLFPGMDATPSDVSKLSTAIEKELRLAGLQHVQCMIDKIVQLYETKLTRHGVMIVGKTGSGKSTVWKVLQAALTRLSKEGVEGHTLVKAYALNPKALDLGELYGEFNINTNEWSDGILSSVVRAACAEEKKDQKWVVLDGPVDTLWIESMNTVLDDNKVLTLINGERIALPEQVSLLFEVENLAAASPATVSRCGMIYMDYKDLGWKPFVESWLNGHKDKSAIEILKVLIEKYVEKILEFRKTCKELVAVPELAAISSLCRLYDALSIPENGVDPSDGDSFGKMVELWFLFSIIWSLGGSLTDESRRKFDMFLREIEGQFPSKDTVYEYYVDVAKKGWALWEEKIQPGWRHASNIPYHKILVPTVDTVRYDFLIKSLTQNKTPFLIVGDVGTGKTSLIQSVLGTLDDSKSVLSINMSAQTSSNRVQNILEGRIEKRTKDVYVPPGGKYLISFVDDLNMPKKDLFGSQPPLEFLRHWLDYGFWYDRQKQSVKFVRDMLLIAAMGPPGGGRNSISPRFQSRFNVINVTFPNETSIKRIFGTIINQKLSDFEEEVKPLGDIMTQATIEIYHTVVSQMLPTPAKIHYLFNLRDISKIFQGLVRAHRDYFDSQESMAKLWVHEVYRVFHDRLVDQNDREWFNKLVDDILTLHFDMGLKTLCPDKRLPIFGDFIHENLDGSPSIYEELTDFAEVKKTLESKLEQYSLETNHVPMKLVLFRDAIEHICRIIRIIRQLRGNCLLIGVGGSGRKSLTKLSAYVIGINVFQVEISKNYRLGDFREDLKKLYNMTGIEGKQTVFLFSDSQIAHEGFLEDINSILTSGEVPNLFSVEEFTQIREALKGVASAEGISDNTDSMFAYFIERVRSNLHVVLCMSPIGDSFRNRLRMFPSLVNCCTIDWFSEWPEDALAEVSMKYLEESSVPENLRKSISTVFVSIHTSVIEQSAKMIQELRRYNHVTPTNYLELVSGYTELLKEKNKEIGEAATKLKNGLDKLDDTRKNVEKISIELEETKKRVSQTQKQCEDFLVIIVQQKREADEQAKGVAARSEKLGVEEAEVRSVADAAQADLDLALPALEAATKALESLNKKDLNEIKSYGKPPVAVEKVMEAVMILKKLEPTWDEAKRQLGIPNFIKQLINFDKDNISDKVLKRINQYCADPDFQPETVGRVAQAAKSLCMWVRAMEQYAQIYRQVAPKKEKLRAAQENLDKKQKTLKEAKTKLQEIEDKVNELKKAYEDKVSLKDKLRAESEETELKLTRAEQLVSGLSGERERWQASIANYEEVMKYLIGDCLLASAFLSYAGPFNNVYRNRLVRQNWLPQVKSIEIPCSADFSMVNFLGKSTETREWSMQGLPNDHFSLENGIIVTRGRRWPLMIDPQGQANSWIKNMEKGLKVIDLKQVDLLKTLENAITMGTPVLLQGVLETVDPSLDPLLFKSIKSQGKRLTIRLGEKEIDYNPDFRFYITTKLANPHYPPEVSSHTTLVNFAVKEKGLEDQLLGIVVRKEKPELEEEKDKLVINMALNRKRLVELEDEILHLLSTAQGSLLDDEKLVKALQSSKSTAEDVVKQLVTSEQTESKIDIAREAYRPCAQRASILYFVQNDLSSVDIMYQFSLDGYIDLFLNSIGKSKKHEDITDRITALNDYHTFSVFKHTCRGLFEKHKTLFSLQMTAKILESMNKLNKDEFDFFLKGGQVLDKDIQLPNPFPDWITETAWDNICELDKLAGFATLASSIEQGEREWHSWFLSNEPEETALPGEWENKLNELQRMLVLRSLRLDRVFFAIQNFIGNNLGQKFIEPPTLDVEDILKDSTSKTPLMFVLSAGVDPMSILTSLAKKHGKMSSFNYISLGQGQAPKATRLLREGMRDGNWVFLANCHLSISWMPTLEHIIEVLQHEAPHEDFRLWLSSSPHIKFPISILQSCIKMTTEPPKGLKANLTRLFSLITPEMFERCKKVDKYRKLLFSLCFFHSILLERKKFLTLGWNVRYDFNDSDFEICENLLSLLLDEYQDTPWDALKYLIAEANYGGRVTDDWDRRILRSYINNYFCDDAINVPMFPLSSMASYYIPEATDLASFKDYISLLPSFDKPEAFGQHPNADITSQIRESTDLLATLVALQPQISQVTGTSREEKVLAIAADILKKIPEEIDFNSANKWAQTDKSPLNVVLLQEIIRYNSLLDKIRNSLVLLDKGIKGVVVMSPDLEEIFNCIVEGKVPPSWGKEYPSLKPLSPWVRDLVQRVEQFAEWAKRNEPNVFWLGGFTFPTGFLTAVLQKAARKNNIPIDALSWEFTVLQGDEESQTQQPPKDGVYVKGIFLEGASWDRKSAYLKDPQPMELVTVMPVIHFKPVENKKKSTKGVYVSPLYYYPNRAGLRERPSFIIAVDLKSGQYDPDVWVKRGTALLLSLST